MLWYVHTVCCTAKFTGNRRLITSNAMWNDDT